jgi:hypothetical protein
MLRQFMLMGDLYKQQGSALESCYFYNQGLELSHSCHSLNFSFAFNLSLSELDLSRARMDESKKRLDDATNTMNKVGRKIFLRVFCN